MPVKKKVNSKKIPLNELIIEVILEKKGEDIVAIDFSKLKNAPFKGFIVCSSTSKVHAEAIADSIEDLVREKSGDKPWHVEGKMNGEWILLDYVDWVVHVFQDSVRKFYQLEKLWADAEIKLITND
jgi:ribosome-associated protein